MAPPRKLDRDRLRELHAAGLDGPRIAAACGVTPDAVRKACRAIGLPLPGPRNDYGGRGKPDTVVRPGQRYGRLVVDRPHRRPGHGLPVVWRCVCDCGGYAHATAAHLRAEPGVKSCGCLRREVAAEHCRRVGLTTQAARRAKKRPPGA